MRLYITLMSLACLLLASTAIAQDEKKKDDPKAAYYGTWNYKTGMKAGVESTEEMMAGEVTIDEKTFVLPGGQENFVMKYEIDFDQKPAHIDFEIASGPAPEGTTAKGIIKIKGDVITLCYHAAGGDRPEKFESTEENGCHLFTMKRAKSAFDAKALVGDWSYISGTQAGEDASEESMSVGVTFDEKKITIPVAEGSEFIFSYEIDADASPVAIDITIEEGPQPGAVALGIIKLEDGTLTLCYDPMGQNRPKKFESTSGNGYFLFELEKDD